MFSGAAKQTQAQFDDLMTSAGNYGEVIHPLLATCTLAGATLPMHYADSAAIHQLNAWVATGSAPPNGPRFTFANGMLAADQYGNTLGGIRMPPIDVPVAHYVSTVCQLGGITVPFTDAEIQGLYKTHAAYYALMKDAHRPSRRGRLALAPRRDRPDAPRLCCERPVRTSRWRVPCVRAAGVQHPARSPCRRDAGGFGRRPARSHRW